MSFPACSVVWSTVDSSIEQLGSLRIESLLSGWVSFSFSWGMYFWWSYTAAFEKCQEKTQVRFFGSFLFLYSLASLLITRTIQSNQTKSGHLQKTRKKTVLSYRSGAVFGCMRGSLFSNCLFAPCFLPKMNYQLLLMSLWLNCDFICWFSGGRAPN